MNKQRKTSHILNVFQYDETTGAVTLPSTLVLTAPAGSDNSTKVPTTAWTRSYISSLGYVTGNQSISITGDVTGSGSTSIELTLANTAVTPGTYGSATLVPVVTVDSKGRITSVTTAAISGALTFTGDVTGTGTTGSSTTLTLANSGVTAGTFTKVTVDSKGRVTVGANATTSDISEGTNLYYTDARVLAYLGANNYATQSYVSTQIANLIGAAPTTLDTLNELAAALGNDPSFATTITTSIGTKVPQARTLTINGTTYDLTANRSWTVPSSIASSTDSAVSSPTSGQLLRYNGTAWANWSPNYLTSFTETDPIYTASSWYITTNNAANWNTAYGWGNHASAGYLTSATASTTYLTQSAAAVTYLTTSTASSTYLTQSGAASNYLTISNASSTYLTLSGASSTYLTQANASNTYASLTGAYANPSWITSLAYSKITGVPAFLTSYTETDTLATVTARGASTTAGINVNGRVTAAGGGTYAVTGSSTQRYIIQALNTSNSVNSSYGWWWFHNTNGDMGFHADAVGDILTLTRAGGANINGNTILTAGNYTSYTYSTTDADSRFLRGTTNPGSVNNFTISIGNNGTYSYVQSHSGQPLRLNPVGNTIYLDSTTYVGTLYANIIYDGNDSGYYLDPNSGSNIATLTLNGNDNQLNINAPTNGASGIFYRENGSNKWETYHYQGRFRFYNYTTNQEELSLDNSGGFLTARTSMRAPIFYDSQDTGYYIDPNGVSRIRGLSIAGNTSSTSTLDQLGFWAVVDGVPNTTSAIGFKQVAGVWADHGLTSGGYNTYFTMDTSNRGWIFRRATNGGSDYTAVNVASISNTGNAQFDGSVRTPVFRFTNSSNNAYLTGNSDWGFRAVNDNGYIQFGPANPSWTHIYSDKSFYFNQQLYVNGTQVVTNSGSWSITSTGNVYARGQSNWNDSTVISNVVGLLSWKNYGNGHVIFDASNGTSPSGGGVSQTNATYAWSASYPTLMGWNGSNTYGVRVDSARVADSASSAATATYATSAGSASAASRAYYSLDGFYNNGSHGSSWIENELPAAQNGAATGRVVLRMWCSEPGVTWDWAGFGYNVLNNGGSPSGFGRYNGNFGQAYMRFATNGDWYFYNTTTGGARTTSMSLGSTGHAQFGSTIGNGSVWINNGGNYNSYNENIRLFNAPNGVSVIAFSASGDSGMPTTSILGYSDRMEFRYGNGQQFRIWDGYVTVAGSLTAASSVTGNDVYTSGGWFRNHTNNAGIYWSGTGWHLMPENSADFRFHSGNNDAAAIRMETNGTTRGYMYVNSSNQIGFLNNSRSWTFRVHSDGRTDLGGDTTASIYVPRHLEARDTWGSCGCISLFLGWSSQKVIIGNGNSGGHDYANGLGSNSVVSTNPFYCYQDITAYSDSRVKENVEVIEDAVEKVKAIRGVTFTRNDVEDLNKRHAGVIAQEILQVLPEAVSEDSRGHLSVAYGNLNALLIEAIKEQQLQIENLKNKLDLLTQNK